MGTPADSRRRVGLVLTGGTIASEPASGGALTVAGEAPGAEEIALLAAAAGPGETLEIEVRSPLRMLSENLAPGDWIAIAEAVAELAEIDEIAGIVVFHGTDTMAYTAAALGYLLADLPKPVVVTGSSLPLGHAGSDAARNAEVALVALGSLGSGAYVAFAGEPGLPGLIHLGTRVRKVRACGQAFASVDGEPVGRVEGRRFEPLGGAPSSRPGDGSFERRLDPRVISLRLHPGLDFELALGAVGAGGIRGVVVELYPSATGPDTGDARSLPEFIRRCGERGVPVFTTVGVVPAGEASRYETTLAIAEAGGLFLPGVLPETATVKLMWALAQRQGPEGVKRLMATPIAGDMPAR